MKFDTPAAKILSEPRMTCGHGLVYSFEEMRTVVDELLDPNDALTINKHDANPTVEEAK